MKVIYAKRIKDILENKYEIFPVGVIPNPKDSYYKAWVYNTTEALSFALNEIMTEGKQDGNKK